MQKAQKINLQLANLHNSLFLESSPGPVKYAVSLLGYAAVKQDFHLQKLMIAQRFGLLKTIFNLNENYCQGQRANFDYDISLKISSGLF